MRLLRLREVKQLLEGAQELGLEPTPTTTRLPEKAELKLWRKGRESGWRSRKGDPRAWQHSGPWECTGGPKRGSFLPLCVNALHCGEGSPFPELPLPGMEASDPGQLVALTLFCASQVLFIITNLPPSAIPCSPLLIPMSWNHQPDSQPKAWLKSLPLPM